MKISIILVSFTVFIIIIITTMNRVFGFNPKKETKARIEQSPNFKNGTFQNLEYTPVMAEDANMWQTMKEFMRGTENGIPKTPIETAPLDLAAFLNPSDSLKYVWFGHSTLMVNWHGTIILFDPVFSRYASPIPFTNKSFDFTHQYNVNELPNIDIVVISHDHYDHLDKATIKALRQKAKRFYVPLGVESHLLNWGIAESQITVADWWDEFTDTSGIQFIATPARHFSGRGLTNRNSTLWCSWVLKQNQQTLYFGGDSGYGTHFEKIGQTFGPFDMAFIECGQYNHNWRFIHGTPEQTVQAAIDLKAKTFVPIHWGKFKLSLHSWTEPIERARAEAQKLNQPLVEPKIGQINTITKFSPTTTLAEPITELELN